MKCNRGRGIRSVINGVKFNVISVTMGWALNQIPKKIALHIQCSAQGNQLVFTNVSATD